MIGIIALIIKYVVLYIAVTLFMAYIGMATGKLKMSFFGMDYTPAMPLYIMLLEGIFVVLYCIL